MWNNIFVSVPSDVDMVWIRAPFFFGNPVLATYSNSTQLFTTVDTSIVIPAYLIGRWKFCTTPAPMTREFKANITQSGTEAPTMNILKNTLGVVPTWRYDDIGSYYLDGLGITDVSKVQVIVGNNAMFPSGIWSTVYIDTIWFTMSDFDNNQLNDVLNNTPITVTIFP